MICKIKQTKIAIVSQETIIAHFLNWFDLHKNLSMFKHPPVKPGLEPLFDSYSVFPKSKLAETRNRKNFASVIFK